MKWWLIVTGAVILVLVLHQRCDGCQRRWAEWKAARGW